MSNIPKEFMKKRINIKKKLVNQNNKPRTSSNSKQNDSSSSQPSQKGQDPDGDDDEGGHEVGGSEPYCRDFKNDQQRDKMTLLPNTGQPNIPKPVPGRSSLTIKSSVIDMSSKLHKPNTLLTITDIASILLISRSTVYRLVEGRKISFIKVGNLIRFTKENLEAFLQSRCINPII